MERVVDITIDMIREYVEETRVYDKMCDDLARASGRYISLAEINDRFMCMQNKIAKKFFGEDLYDIIQWRLFDNGKKISFDCDTDSRRDYVLESDEDFYEMVEKEYLSGEKK